MYSLLNFYMYTYVHIHVPNISSFLRSSPVNTHPRGNHCSDFYLHCSVLPILEIHKIVQYILFKNCGEEYAFLKTHLNFQCVSGEVYSQTLPLFIIIIVIGNLFHIYLLFASGQFSGHALKLMDCTQPYFRN